MYCFDSSYRVQQSRAYFLVTDFATSHMTRLTFTRKKTVTSVYTQCLFQLKRYDMVCTYDLHSYCNNSGLVISALELGHGCRSVIVSGSMTLILTLLFHLVSGVTPIRVLNFTLYLFSRPPTLLNECIIMTRSNKRNVN